MKTQKERQGLKKFNAALARIEFRWPLAYFVIFSAAVVVAIASGILGNYIHANFTGVIRALLITIFVIWFTIYLVLVAVLLARASPDKRHKHK
ncbi:MAG: hypothetical protein QXS81_01180 [Candidatus Micrarchaeaceae archaeon]